MTFADTYSISSDEIDMRKIYWGNSSNFKTPAEVDYEKILYATSEYKSIKKGKIEKGTAKYWILISKANDHAVRVIIETGEEAIYDLIAAKEYLGGLDPPIKCKDITKLILKKLE